MEKCWLRSSSPWYIWLLNCGSSVSWCFPEAGSDLQEGETILSCCGDVPLELPPLTLLVTNVEREWGMQSNLLQEQHIISQLTHECSLANSSLGEGFKKCFKNKKELSIEGSYPLVGWSKNILLKCILRAFLVLGKSHQPIENFQNVFLLFWNLPLPSSCLSVSILSTFSFSSLTASVWDNSDNWILLLSIRVFLSSAGNCSKYLKPFV